MYVEERPNVELYFTDAFKCDAQNLEEYGALNISLVTDLPLFIDPFLLFNSRNPVYQKLHNEMIRYIQFLQEMADSGPLDPGLMKSWYTFSEVKQNWLGYSESGNDGRGLGPKFARALHANLGTILKDLGQERITHGRHIEKVCLIGSGVGRDNVSDFTTNLIKLYLLEYTEAFAKQYIASKQRKRVAVERVTFNWDTQTWETRTFDLPWFNNDFVLLTPEDILSKDDTWISQQGFFRRYSHIVDSIPNDQLRSQLDAYFKTVLPRKPRGKAPTQEEKHAAIMRVVAQFPQILDYYIKDREERGNDAVESSSEKVQKTKELFIKQVGELATLLQQNGFYRLPKDSYEEAMERVVFLKRNIEDNDGYRFFYVDGQPIERESDLKLIYRLTWFASSFEVDSEVNNGRGPVDYKISKGSADKSLVEFKLATNTQLEQNLAKQVEVYKKANATQKAIKVIIFFTLQQHRKVLAILKRLEIDTDTSVVLIDARNDNKVSASKVRIATEE
jgi:hypothetical protein